MQRAVMDADKKKILANLLKECSCARSITVGRLVHEEIMKLGFDKRTSVGNMIMSMYVRNHSLEDARKVFEDLKQPDVVSWGTIITGYASHDCCLDALILFDCLQKSGIVPNAVVLLGLLKVCLLLGGLERTFQVHDLAVRHGLETDVIVISMLINVYTKHGIVEEGHVLFQNQSDGNIVTWGSLIAGYVHNEDGVAALSHFERMKAMCANADKFIYSSALKACSLLTALDQGKRLHAEILHSNLKLDGVVENSLLDMYAKCGDLGSAKEVFNRMASPDLISWGALIAGYVQCDHGESALEIHEEMERGGWKPDLCTSSCLLKACGIVGDLQYGRLIHEYIVSTGYSANKIVGNALVDMYARCGSIEDAQKAFMAIYDPDTVSWDSIIAGLVQNGKNTYALALFKTALENGLHFDQITFLSLLKACANIHAVEEGRLLNEQIVLKGFESDIVVGNAIIDMYVKCGSLKEAEKVFHKLPQQAGVSWGAIILGYAEHESYLSASKLLDRMLNENVQLNSNTLLCILKACSKIRAMRPGRLMHSHVIVCGYDEDMAINNILLDLYGKCGSLCEARRLFDDLSNRTVVTWDTMIAGYALHGACLSALDMWRKMCEENVEPIKVTFVSVLKACSMVGAIEYGRKLYHYIICSGLYTDMVVTNSVLEMYASCGVLEDANQLFKSMESPDLVSWTVRISGMAYRGRNLPAMELLKDLQSQNLKPNEEIFLCLLRACRQAGRVNEGYWCFESMIKEHALSPSIEHCSCMIDLFGHVGDFQQAVSFVNAMPCEPDAVVWTSLLANSDCYGNTVLGNFCSAKLAELSQDDSFCNEQHWEERDLQQAFLTSEEQEVEELTGLVSKESGTLEHGSTSRTSGKPNVEKPPYEENWLRPGKGMPCMDFATWPTHASMMKSVIFGTICANYVGTQHLQVRSENNILEMAVQVF